VWTVDDLQWKRRLHVRRRATLEEDIVSGRVTDAVGASVMGDGPVPSSVAALTGGEHSTQAPAAGIARALTVRIRREHGR
jgi:hypothetical protein